MRLYGFDWQSRYWHHIIRDEKSYQNIATYIENNPTNWENDGLMASSFKIKSPPLQKLRRVKVENIGQVSNYLIEDFDSILMFMSAEKKAKKPRI